MQTDPVLWQTLNAYDLDAADAAFPFSRRLARDNGWSHAYAKRAIAEYKRFIYLVCVSGHTCTPSEDVDAVWHLHLIYTRDYWDRLCAETLRRRIDHGPTRGGQAEGKKYLDCYRRTLDGYATEFGTSPPSDIWPAESVRFGRPDRYQRIDTDRVITLPKRQVFLCLGLAATSLLAACAGEKAMAVATTALTVAEGLSYKEWLLVALFIAIIWACLASATSKPKRRRRGKSKGDGSGCGSGCSGIIGCGSDSGGHGGGHGCGSSGCGSGCGGGGGCGGGCGGGD